jgi:uncharacterized protein (TIGR04141 family)
LSPNEDSEITEIAVDLNATLLRDGTSPDDAVQEAVTEDATTAWFQADDRGGLYRIETPSANADVTLLMRKLEGKVPAWHQLFEQVLRVDGFRSAAGDSSGAILFVRTLEKDAVHHVAWCFGQGSHWLRRDAGSPRFGLLVALNALADPSDSSNSSEVGVTGASVAAREGNLRRADLIAAAPTTASGISRLDPLVDVLTAARVRTGHKALGSVDAAKSLRFAAVVRSLDTFRELSALITALATQEGYRRLHGWIDNTVPETDARTVDAVLNQVWQGGPESTSVGVEIAWWEDVREGPSDHPVTHWRLASERRGGTSSRTLTLTWGIVRSRIKKLRPSLAGREALETEVRFFDADEDELGRCRALDLLSATVILANKTYVLVDGEVCRVDASFLEQLDSYLANHQSVNRLVPYSPGELEGPYNGRAAHETQMLVLDKTDIRPSGETQIEPCDLLSLDGTLYHVKRHSTAAGISHLTHQALASATVLLHEPESRQKLCALVDQSSWDEADRRRLQEAVQQLAMPGPRLRIVLAIIGEWYWPTVASLSLLSRLALRTAIQRLEDLGFATELMLIDAAPVDHGR